MRHFINLFQEREKKMENKIEQSKEKVAFITLRVEVSSISMKNKNGKN